MFYGPGGPYALFTGRDASRALALMSFDPKDLTGNIEGLSASELEVLQDWEYKFMEKYVKVGQIVLNRNDNGNEVEASKTDGNESQENVTEGIDASKWRKWGKVEAAMYGWQFSYAVSLFLWTGILVQNMLVNWCIIVNVLL